MVKKYLLISVGILFVSLTIYGYSQRIDFFANSPCPSGELYVERVIGGWKQTTSTNPLGLCLNADDIKNDLVQDPTLKDKLISFFRYTIFNQQANAAGNTYYVATNGEDSRSCSEAQNISTPKQNIMQTIRCMSSGDTLLIRGGTYYQSIESFSGSPFPSGTSWDNLITIKGYPGETVTLKSTAPDVGGIVELCWGESYMSFENLIFEKAKFSNECGAGEDKDPMPHHIRWKNTEVIGEDIGSPGGACHYCEFLNHTRHDGPSYTFYMAGTNNLIDGAHIWNMGHDVEGCVPPDQPGGVHCGFGGYAIHIRSSTGYPIDNWVIRNSLIHDNRQAGIFIQGGNHLIYNNIIYNSKKEGYLTGTGGSKVFNNTFVNNPGGIAVNVAAPIEARNNILWNSGGVTSEDSSLIIQSNNLTTDPLFVNPSANDYHLRTGSPAINAGMTIPEVPCDFDGNGRPAGSGYDIGAYEYGGSPSSDCKQGPVSSPGPSPTGSPRPSSSPSPSPTPPPSISLTANPSSVPAPGYTVLIQWQVQNASSCSASNGWSGSKNPQQGSENAFPNQTTTYTLTCQGPGGSSQKSVTVTVGQAGGACHLLDSSKPVPPGWGAAYNPLSPQKELLISVSCDTQTATFNLGNNQQTTYIYHQGYIKPGGSTTWMPVTFSGSNIQANAWYPAKATYFKAFNPNELSQTGQVAAYMCHWTGYPNEGGGGWKCGCRDSACATPYWQLQEFRR